MTVLDTVANSVVTTIPVATNPTGVAVTPDGSRVYVTHNPGNTVTVIDTSTNSVLTTVTVGTNPFGIVVKPSGTRVYVTHTNTDDVQVIDTSSNLVIATIPGGSTPYGVAVSPDGSKVYQSNSASNTVRVIDTATNTVTGTINVGSSPQGIAVSPDGTRVLAVNQASNDVSVIDTGSNLVIATVPVGSGPRAFGIFIGGPVPTAPAITVTGSTAFPATTVGSSSAVQTVTITNTGTATLTLNSFGHSAPAIYQDTTGGPPPNAAHWCGFGSSAGGVPLTAAPINLAPMANCQLNLVFKPNAAGPLPATITVNSNAPTSPTMISLTGTGIAPTASIGQTGLPAGTIVPGHAVNMAITVSGGAGTPTGSVTVKLRNLTTMVVTDINGGVCLMATLSSGTFNCPFTTPAADNYSIEVSYSGDGTYPAPGSPTTFALTTAQAVPNVNQTGSPGTAVPGQSVSMLLNVTSSSPLGPPTGTVTVKLRNLTTMIVTDINGGTCLMANLTSGSFTCPYTTPAAGNYQIEVSYSGDTPNAPALGTFFLTTTQATPTVNQTGSPGTAVPGQSVSMLLNVTSSSPLGPPTGTVTVKLRNLTTMIVTDINGGTCLMAGLTSGSFTCPYTTPAAGNYQIEVSYSGDTPNAPALGTFFLTTTQAAPTVNQTGSPASATPGQSISMMLTVTSSSPLGPPTGTVTVKLRDLTTMIVTDINGGTCLMAGLTSGAFTCPYTASAVGNYQIEASYSGDTPNAPALGTFALTVAAAVTPTMTVAFAPASVASGVNSTLTVTIVNPAASSASIGLGSLVNVPSLTMSSLTDSCSLAVFISGATIDFGMTGVIPAMTTCTITVQAQSAMTGSFPVTVMPGNLITSQGNNANTSTSTLTVTAAPTVSMTVAFAPTSMSTGANSIMTLTLTNPGASSAFISGGNVTIPAGLTATPPGSNTCGTFGSVTAGVYSFGMGFIPAMGSCTIDLTVTTATPGTYTVTIMPGNLSAGSANTNTSGAALTVTAAAAGPYAYVPLFNNFTGNSVAVVDPVTLAVVTTITVGLGPVAAAVNATNTRVYVSNQQANSISVIDTSTNSVIATIPVGSQPGTLALNAAGTVLYVPNQTGNTVSVINTASNTVAATISGLNFPSGVVVNPAGTRVYVTLAGTNALAVIDTSTNAVITNIPVASGAYMPVINGAGTRVYVVSTSGVVAVIDTATNTVVTTIPVGTNPRGIAVNPAGTIAYVTNSGSNNISVLNLTNNTVLATPTSGTGPWGVASNSTGTRMYVANNSVNTLSAFDTSTHSIAGGAMIGTGPVGLGQFIVPAVVAGGPSIGFSPSGSVNFGTRTVNTTSPVQTVMLTNTGSASLFISGITSTGDFAYTTTCPMFSAPLVAGANCNIDITFTPLTAATLAGSVNIASNAPGSPHTITLAGTGTAVPTPTVTLSAATINFGSVPLSTASAVQSVSILNSGFATLTISGITKTGSGSFTRVAPATPGPDCTTSVAPGAKCYISVTFTPVVVGAVTGQFSIASNAASSPDIVSLAGTGAPAAAPAISVPASVDFGDQIINTVTTRTLDIVNSGTAPLFVSSVVISGAQVANFSTSGNCSNVPVGGSCAISITFAAATVGVKNAQITIVSDAANQPTATVALSGNGILAPRPIADLTATAIGFGNAIFGGATSSQVITLKNIGGAALQIQNLYTLGDFVQMTSCPASLPSGASCLINVLFSPLGVGYRSGSLNLVSNALGSPQQIPLSGTGCRWFSPGQGRLFITACGN